MTRRASARIAACCALALTMFLGGCLKLLEVDLSDPIKRLGEPPAPFRVIDVSHRGEAWRPTFMRRLAKTDYDLLILGEIHDNPDHHRLQEWLIRTLNGLRKRSSVQPTALFGGVQGLAFEMVPTAREAEINALRKWRPGLPRPGESAAATAAIGRLIHEETGGAVVWSDYAPIIGAAPQALITGAFEPREGLRALAEQGAEAAPEAARYGLDAPLAPGEQAVRETAMIMSHCNKLPAAVAPAMVAAQRIRDARLAEALLRAEAKGYGFAILIAGNEHARKDWGAPQALNRAAPEKRVISIAMIEAAPGDPLDLASLGAEFGAATPPFDYVIATPPRLGQGDPCVGIR